MSRGPVKLAYDLHEPEDGSNDDLSPLIFLHALFYSKEQGWGDIPQAIGNRTKRKVYNLDVRNHGDSEWSDEFDEDLCAVDLLHFMDEKKIQKAVLVGHCTGGIAAIKAALKAPEKIEMLFIEDVFIDVPEVVNNAIISYTHLWKEAEKLIPPELDKTEADKFITKHILRKKAPLCIAENTHELISYDLRKDSSGRYVFKANLDVLLKKAKNINGMLGEMKGSYKGPSYFLIAQKSPYKVSTEKFLILKYFPKATFVHFEGGNHFIHKEFPEKFIEEVVKYIQLNEKNSMLRLEFVYKE